MSRRRSHLALAALGWLGFNVVTLWAVAFLAGVVVPRTVDGPHRHRHRAWPWLVDLALLLLFAVQHSVMARRRSRLAAAADPRAARAHVRTSWRRWCAWP